MYQRVKNKLDAGFLCSKLCEIGTEQIVIDRVNEVIDTLDDSYGEKRNSYAMGGYILFFQHENDYEKSIAAILDFYNLKEDLYEYSDCINEMSKTDPKWWEELYMLGSDDALVIIHPKN